MDTVSDGGVRDRLRGPLFPVSFFRYFGVLINDLIIGPTIWAVRGSLRSMAIRPKRLVISLAMTTPEALSRTAEFWMSDLAEAAFFPESMLPISEAISLALPCETPAGGLMPFLARFSCSTCPNAATCFGSIPSRVRLALAVISAWDFRPWPCESRPAREDCSASGFGVA